MTKNDFYILNFSNNGFKIFLLIISFLNANLLLAQENRIEGIVHIDFSENSPQGIYVTNLRTEITAITDLMGRFFIDADVGDSLKFSGSFIKERTFILNSDQYKRKSINIHLNQDIIELAELVVNAPLTGFIEEDVKSVKLNNDVEKIYANLGVDIRMLDMEPRERKGKLLPRIGNIPIPTSLNVEVLAKIITGYYRKQENLRLYEQEQNKLDNSYDYLGEEYFTKELGIPKYLMRQFIYYAYAKETGLFNLSIGQKDFLTLDSLFRRNVRPFLRLKENS